MKISPLKASLIGIIFGILFNSVEIKEYPSFIFNNPIALSGENRQETIDRAQLVTDTNFNLRFLGFKIPIVTYRTVQDPFLFKRYSGRLDKKGNIHTKKGIYNLMSAHDTNWYVKKN